MALDPRKLQKKKEKQNSRKRRLHAARKAHPSISEKSVFERADRYPLLCCATTDTLFDTGIGYVLVTREVPQRQVAGALFLVDVYCVGVKNALTFLRTHGEYERDILRGPVLGGGGRREVEPSYARKLVEGAVEYAAALGLAPAADYRIAKSIFGKIDPTECSEEFEYGKDGHPLFVSGPFDSAADCRAILSTLRQTCGADGFDFLVAVGSEEFDH
jgi:hypothetical protein